MNPSAVLFQEHVETLGSIAMQDRKMQPQDLNSLYRFHYILDEFHKLSPHMPVAMINAFLLVAMEEGKSLREYTDMSGVPTPSMSRYLIDLSKRNRKKEEGYDLVVSHPDPMEMRRKMYRLTPKGRALRDRILQKMSK